jgi:hypothetical protein
MARRYRDMMRDGNFWEGARTLARTCFDKAGEPWQGHPTRPPLVVVASGWRRRWTLGRQVRQLWELAYGLPPVPIGPRQFARVVALVQSVEAALSDGSLRFQQPVPAK